MMSGLTASEPNHLAVLWRRKWIAIATVVLVVAVTVAVSKSLTPVYSTTATLIVSQPGSTQTFDSAQGSEEAARSFAQVLSGPDFARDVAGALGGGVTASSVTAATTIQSVANTELITITAESSHPVLAARIANTYARVFLGFAPHLTPQIKTSVTLANSATVPTGPIRPKPTLYALAAALLGLAAGIALAFMRERFDVRVRSAEEISALVDLPVLATVPVRGARNLPAFVEAFRLLRTTLKFSDDGEELRRFAITSWSEGEGKTTVAYQLALVVGMAGGRNVLIDGDTHRAGLHKLVAPTKDPHQRAGLTEFVLGSVPMQKSLYRTGLPSVSFMPPGRTIASLSNLLESSVGSTALQKLGAAADTVIVDCPPLAASADASTLATKVDGVILVVDLRKATTVSIRRAVNQLQSVGAHIVGLVINQDSNTVALDYYSDYADGPSANGSGSPLSRLRTGLGRGRHDSARRPELGLPLRDTSPRDTPPRASLPPGKAQTPETAPAPAETPAPSTNGQGAPHPKSPSSRPS